METAADDGSDSGVCYCQHWCCVWTYDKHIGGGGANVILMTRIYQRVPLINVGCQPHAAHSGPSRGETLAGELGKHFSPPGILSPYSRQRGFHSARRKPLLVENTSVIVLSQ